MAVRLGAEWTPLAFMTARIGAYCDGIFGAPSPDGTLTPSSPDSTRIGLTLGATFRALAWLSVDLYYEHMQLISRESTSDDAPMAKYRGYANLVGLGLRFHTSFKKGKSTPAK
jgi:hypothetical protein